MAMADKTFGVKVSEELYDKVKGMIDVSGVSSKEWFEKAVALTSVQNLKDGSGSYKQDLTELEIHTTRIYELVGNMINRAEYLKMDAVKELEGKLESKELIISELQTNVKKLTEDNHQFEQGIKKFETDKQELSEQVESFRSANDNNQSLIQEYKEKIDTLSGLVTKYQGYASENNELKTSHAAEKEQMKADFGEKENRLNSSIEELKSTVRDQEILIEQLKAKLEQANEDFNAQFENQKVNFNNQLSQLTDKKELEKERAILDIERKYQDKLEQAHEQYNDKLSRLFEKLETKGETAG
jgi:chromosome segregation ATPase